MDSTGVLVYTWQLFDDSQNEQLEIVINIDVATYTEIVYNIESAWQR